jgi:hypothetical protein
MRKTPRYLGTINYYIKQTTFRAATGEMIALDLPFAYFLPVIKRTRRSELWWKHILIYQNVPYMQKYIIPY